MEKMVKYNSYDSNLKSGDFIVFVDGTQKTISKIDGGHKVIFDDGSQTDLWVIEDQIKGIIHNGLEKTSPEPSDLKLVERFTNPIKKKDYLVDRTIQPFFNPLAYSYEELRKLIYNDVYNAHFFHYSEYHNVLSMINSGYIYSRYHGLYKIKYDNAKLIETTNNTTSTNKSWELERYVRFYLNPKNEVAYAFRCSFKEHNSFGVIITLPFSAINKANTNVLLAPYNAHYLPSSYFDWQNFNIGFSDKNLRNYNGDEFNYAKTFEPYDDSTDNKYLTAEVLFFEKVSIDLVDNFCFKTEYEKEIFLSELDYNKRNLIEKKCIVRKELFY